MVGELILVSYHVVVLDTVKLPFEFPNLGAVCVHLLTETGPIFVDLLDDQRGVFVYHEAFDAELDGYTESVETCFILHNVVGCWKINSENVSELILARRNEQNASTSIVDVEGAIKVHHPVLEASSGDELLDLDPLSNEVSEHM